MIAGGEEEAAEVNAGGMETLLNLLSRVLHIVDEFEEAALGGGDGGRVPGVLGGGGDGGARFERKMQDLPNP